MADLRPSAKHLDSIFALAIATLLFFGCLAIFEPIWDSNDDSGLSMTAHGYGNALLPSSHLIYQNVIVGKALGALPAIAGVLPYSWLTLAIVLASSSALLLFAIRLSGDRVLPVAGLALVLPKLIAAPQFTVVAGVATAAGLLALSSYVREPSSGSFAAAAGFLCLGFLWRWDEFAFVLLVCLPLLVWMDRTAQSRGPVALALVLILASAVVDWSSYQGPEWAIYKAVEPYRVQLTDFAWPQQLTSPDYLRSHGYSENDLNLLGWWFFVDSRLADPARLKLLLEGVNAPLKLSEILPGVRDSLAAFADPTLAPLTLAAAVTTLFCRHRWALAVAWFLFIAAIVAWGVLGRPGILRIYYPVLVLLLFAGLAFGVSDPYQQLKRAVLFLALVAAAAYSARFFIASNQAKVSYARTVAEDVAQLDKSEVYIVWASGFPYEFAVPVLSQDSAAAMVRHYSLGSTSLAPFEMATLKASGWPDLIDRLLRDRDIPFIAKKSHIDLLATYCQEHHKRALQIKERHLNTFDIFFVTCADNRGP